MPNFAALRAAVFQLSTKNLRGGGYPPPVGARVSIMYSPSKCLSGRGLSQISRESSRGIGSQTVFFFCEFHAEFHVKFRVIPREMRE